MSRGNDLVKCTCSTAPRMNVSNSEQRLRDALGRLRRGDDHHHPPVLSLVLKSLGVAGDTDAGVALVENLDDLVGRDRRRPATSRISDSKRQPLR